MSEAIRQSLRQYLHDADIAIRFNVPRDRLSDNAAHAILRIARELTANAIRHGHATSVKIAGSIENGRLLMSVRDNGSGFDPESCPGPSQGHFGLQGIRERVASFGGTLTVTSAPKNGVKATISIRLPHDQQG